MDFSTINTEADAGEGAEMHVMHPQLGHRLYTGEGANELGELVDKSKGPEPVILRIRGMESEFVQEKIKAAKKAAMRKPDDVEAGYDLVISLVMEIKGVKNGEKVITTSREDLVWFFKRSDGFVQQVMDFAREPSNFFRGGAQT